MTQLIRAISSFIPIQLHTFLIDSREAARLVTLTKKWLMGLSPEAWKPIQRGEGIFASGGARDTTLEEEDVFNR